MVLSYLVFLVRYSMSSSQILVLFPSFTWLVKEQQQELKKTKNNTNPVVLRETGYLVFQSKTTKTATTKTNNNNNKTKTNLESFVPLLDLGLVVLGVLGQVFNVVLREAGSFVLPTFPWLATSPQSRCSSDCRHDLKQSK